LLSVTSDSDTLVPGNGDGIRSGVRGSGSAPPASPRAVINGISEAISAASDDAGCECAILVPEAPMAHLSAANRRATTVVIIK
jgi:hypothetical protein